MDSTSGAIVLLVVFLLVYFLPSFVASGRERNGGVIVLNLFLGWTLIGWVVALAWAATLEHAKVAVGPSGESLSEPAVVQCPFCAEDIKPQAVVCKHCNRDLAT